jgi:hypothetical protein
LLEFAAAMAEKRRVNDEQRAIAVTALSRLCPRPMLSSPSLLPSPPLFLPA